MIHRAVILAEGRLIRPEHISVGKAAAPGAATSAGASLGARKLKDLIGELERSLLVQALQRTGWNQSAAAKLLGIHRRLLFTKISKYKIKKTA